MALMALFYFLSLARNLHGILAAPALSMINISSRFERDSNPASAVHMLTALPVISWVNLHRQNQHAFSVAIPTTVTMTINIAEQPTAILSPVPATTTVTSYVTIPTSSQTPSLPPMVISSLQAFGPSQSMWVAPPKIKDLTAFNVTSFTSGEKNLQIVNQIPTSALADVSNPQSENVSSLQISFPQGSIDPANTPVGGAQFYATPLDITKAQNVSLQYSALFPANFDFVLAGKMPGLYGGPTGCSGGNAATNCFSTRLMWRQEGAGELYLYAPKNQQTEALCSASGSVCDDSYGISIGRGSFRWATGKWTTVRQTVILNTPGAQDGSFTLDVNGMRVIERHDILYRINHVDNNARDQGSHPTTQDPCNDPQQAPIANAPGDTALINGQVTFTGMFFSTFFGGHGAQYATPRSQQIWFKDFAMAYNS